MMPELGAYIGEGRCRTVYVAADDPTKAVKVAKEGHADVNLAEAGVWRDVEDRDEAAFYAPVTECAEDGSWLVMARTRQPSEGDFPSRIPGRIGDVKRHNWGWLNGRMVCHDYHVRGGSTGKLKSARWKGEIVNERTVANRP